MDYNGDFYDSEEEDTAFDDEWEAEEDDLEQEAADDAEDGEDVGANNQSYELPFDLVEQTNGMKIAEFDPNFNYT